MCVFAATDSVGFLSSLKEAHEISKIVCEGVHADPEPVRHPHKVRVASEVSSKIFTSTFSTSDPFLMVTIKRS